MGCPASAASSPRDLCCRYNDRFATCDPPELTRQLQLTSLVAGATYQITGFVMLTATYETGSLVLKHLGP
jgi:hypothetical protein